MSDMLTRRCQQCQICPQPKDFHYMWDGQVNSPLCRWCRKKEDKPTTMTHTHSNTNRGMVGFRLPNTKFARLFVATKLQGMEIPTMRLSVLPMAMRNAMLKSMSTPGTEVYVTDGKDRIWPWSTFPNSQPYGWPELIASYKPDEWAIVGPSTCQSGSTTGGAPFTHIKV